MKTFFIFGLSFFIGTNVMAATGTGHAQAELASPLIVVNGQNVDFGIIAIDPAAGSQTVSMSATLTFSCPSAYVCSTPRASGRIIISGAPNTMVYYSVEGSMATLSDGLGHTLAFDPLFQSDLDASSYTLFPGGSMAVPVGGSLYFTGNEVSGTYNTTNAGGSGYQVTVNY
ncbi:MAG: DUF4402 domain-containing protein [Alphaproteobacteria bacterium]|nr:DUF4402 domain-containing protein [Alphaproteobacteria bacterium]MBN2779499.1 DUF4402 domain-containing protein [Alphaproteobacteria bacterium]